MSAGFTIGSRLEALGPFSNGRVADLIIFTLRFLAAGGVTIGMYFAGQNGGL